MTEREFKEIINRAKQDDFNALEEVLKLYKPMIEKYSYLFGRLDEDLKQYISLRIIAGIKGFRL